MQMKDSFNEKIKEIIDLHAYELYYIKRDSKIVCSCIKHETKQADPACPKCLGTGRKITIRKFKGAAQDTKLPPTFRSDRFIVARSFFVKDEIDMVKDDIIVDGNTPYIVLEVQELIGLGGSIPYRKTNGVKKKFDTEIFMKNFESIIKVRSRQHK